MLVVVEVVILLIITCGSVRMGEEENSHLFCYYHCYLYLLNTVLIRVDRNNTSISNPDSDTFTIHEMDFLLNQLEMITLVPRARLCV